MEDEAELIADLFDGIHENYKGMVEEDGSSRNLRDKDFLTRIDIETEELIEEFFRSQDGSFILQSEETPEFDENPKQGDYTVIFDSIDASHHLIEGEGSSGPVVGIAEGKDPCFKDIVAAGFLDLNYSRKHTAVKGKGSHTTDLETGERAEINASGREELGVGAETKILLQQGFLSEYPEIAREAWKRWCADYGSQARHYAMVASGKRDIYITGGHSQIDAKPANTPEEAAGMYLLVKEAGGSITDWEGNRIEDREIGMDKEKNHDLIAAGTRKLAEKTAEEIIPENY